MTKNLHIAAQYLAAASISFLTKENDDSHTNLAWDNSTKSLLSRSLRDDGLHMALSLKDFSIEFRRKEMVLAKVPLSQTRHGDNIKWISEVFRDLLYEHPYEFNLHYELPYDDVNQDYVFPYRDEVALKEHAELRSIAHNVLSEIAMNHNEPVEVRVWPHHFDSGSLLWMGEMDSLGIGLAMADSMIKQPYFYVSGWHGPEMTDTKGFSSLKKGSWLTDQWKGAVLKAKGKSVNEIRQFFNEAMERYRMCMEKVA
ncbi:MAG: hypothetical protein RIC15_11875 [Vicingaceae bacterium]